MKSLRAVCLLLFMVTSAWAQTTKAPLGEASLLGTWHLVSTSDSPEVRGQPLEGTDMRWTFVANGKGSYFQKLSLDDDTGSSPMSWKLKGNTLLFDGKTECTVESFSGDGMVWRLHPFTDYYYYVERR